MIVDAIRKIEDMAKCEVIELDGRNYTTQKLFPATEPRVDSVDLYTLTGLADYLEKIKPEEYPGKVIVHVSRFNSVKVISHLKGDFLQRDLLIVAEAPGTGFPFNSYQNQEEFLINLMTGFEETEELKALIKVVGNLTDNLIKTSTDDGFSQETVVKSGIAKVANAKVTNPVYLRPFSTFPEIKQPEQPFVFRLRKSGDGPPMCALYKSDTSEWKLECQLKIQRWLEERGVTDIIL